MEIYQRKLSINMAVLAVLGTILLGMGQEDPKLPLLTVTVALVAVYFTDIKRWFHLNHMVANGAALVAVAISLFDFARFDRNQQLLAIANLLVYLQVVVFFQEKNTRIYWQMAMLSLLQVVVAAALNFSVLFGILLVIYMFIGLSALSRFYLYREAVRSSQQTESVVEPVFWPLVWRRRTVSEEETAFTASRQVDLASATRHRGIMWIVARMGLASLLLTVLVFFSIPRFGQSAWRAAGGAPQRVVGFSQNVTLGALGEVIQSPQVVMRLQLVDDATGKAFQLRGEPLLRGSVVTRYDPETAQWSQESWSYRNEVLKLPKAEGRTGVVRQRITLEPLNEPVVFSIYPALRYRDTDIIRYDADRQQLFRPERLRSAQLNFDLATSGIAERAQRMVMPYSGRAMLGALQRYLHMPLNDDGSDPFVGLRRIAAEAAAESRSSSDNHYLVAQALESFLKTKGGFEYTLVAEKREPGFDPIEDFVVNNRRGHCEYFASALTLMLRSQGIPARMVIGYKGGEWNSLGAFYQVRQLHAHTWVEAYLGPAQLAMYDFRLGDSAPSGGWLRLDPTADTIAELSAATGVLASIGELVDYVEMLWTTHIVGMNYQQQQRNFYQPVAESFSEVARGVFGEEAGEDAASWSFSGLFQAAWRWLRGNWFSWRGGLAAMVFCLVLVGCYRLGLLLIARLRQRSAASRDDREYQAIGFYRRLESILALHGFRREAAQTPREFAMAAAGQLADRPSLRSAARLPRQVVDAFYLVRFGRRTLDNQQAEALENDLQTLEMALRGVRREA
jgi:transglutaminase-like putative cysteine protease